jgi:hypothetical protein
MLILLSTNMPEKTTDFYKLSSNFIFALQRAGRRARLRCFARLVRLSAIDGCCAPETRGVDEYFKIFVKIWLTGGKNITIIVIGYINFNK